MTRISGRFGRLTALRRPLRRGVGAAILVVGAVVALLWLLAVASQLFR